MPNYDALQGKKSSLIRKAKNGSVFLGPITAPAITTLLGDDGLLAPLPEGYTDLGWLSDDGINMPRDTSSSDVTGFGSTTPLRTDLTTDTTTIEVVGQETNRTTLALYTGATDDDLTPSGTGEVVINKPGTPRAQTFRVLALAVDTTDAGEVYIARFFPRTTVDSYDDLTFQSGDDPIQWSATLKAAFDTDEGTSERWLFGGPGWAAILADMGFDAGAGGGSTPVAPTVVNA